MKLIQELFGNGILNEQKKNELEAELKKTGKTEEDIILERKIVSEDVLFKLKSSILKIPLKKIKAEDIPLDILEIVPEEAAINYKMAAFAKRENVIEIGMVYPEDILAQNALRFLSQRENFNYETCLITIADFNNLLKQYRNLKNETKKALEEIGKEKKEGFGSLEKKIGSKIMIEEAPIIKVRKAP